MSGRVGVFTAAALGGVGAAVLDVGVAALINRVPIDVVLRAIARGVLGRSAMSGGAPVAAFGFALQLLMGALIGAIYGVAATPLPVLTERWPILGLAYGVAIFATMEFVVVPLSAVGRITHFTPLSLTLNLGAMLLFGVIVARAAARGAAA